MPSTDPWPADAASLDVVLSCRPPAPPHTASEAWSGWLYKYKINALFVSVRSESLSWAFIIKVQFKMKTLDIDFISYYFPCIAINAVVCTNWFSYEEI